MKFVWAETINRFFRTEGDAKKQKLPYKVVELEVDKDSLIAMFNGYEERIEQLLAGHTAAPQPADEEAPEPGPATPPPPRPTQAPAQSYTEWSVNLDDAWDKLPLARKLHFAADAMECARNAIPEAKSLVDPRRSFGAAPAHGRVDHREPAEEAAATADD